jgi:hypothetical protein
MLRNFMDVVLTGGSEESADLPSLGLPDPPSFEDDMPPPIEGPTRRVRIDKRRVR